MSTLENSCQFTKAEDSKKNHMWSLKLVQMHLYNTFQFLNLQSIVILIKIYFNILNKFCSFGFKKPCTTEKTMLNLSHKSFFFKDIAI